MPEISLNASRLVNAELHDGESIVWSSAPKPGNLVLKTLPVILFAVPWTGFAVFWMVMAGGFNSGSGFQIGSVFALFGVPFVLIGIGMLLSPFLVIRAARESAYVITDRRALVFTAKPWGGTAITSFPPDQLKNLTRNQRLDGSGDVVFQDRVSSAGNGDKFVQKIGFIGVDDAKAVEDLLVKLANSV
jgi:hypothetical protein